MNIPCGEIIGHGETCSSFWLCNDCQEKLDRMSGFKKTNPDNPYAFPFPTNHPAHEGMTLRDWFAGQALTGLLAGGTPDDAHVVARCAYFVADAMLAERTTTPKED